MIEFKRRDWVVAKLYRDGNEGVIGVEYPTLEAGLEDVKASHRVAWPYRVIFTDYEETRILYVLFSADFEPTGGESEWSRVLRDCQAS